jgi:hypothetical protein
MKQTFPVIESHQSSAGRNNNKFRAHSAEYDSGARQYFYRSVILAVSGSLFCVAAGEVAAPQANADQLANGTSSRHMLAETAQSSPPATFSGFNAVMEQVQWPAQPLSPANPPIYPATPPAAAPVPPPAQNPPVADTNAPPVTDTNAPAMPDTNAPALMDTNAPAMIDTNAPALTVTNTPALIDTNAPVMTDTNAPLPAASTAPAAPAATEPDTNALPAIVTPSAIVTPDTTATLALPGLPIQQPTVYKNDLSASADFMYGVGTITVPIGFGLKAHELPGASFPVSTISADRSTVYYGGTISYSYGRSWYLDFSGEKGTSTGSTSITIPGVGGGGAFPASFDVNDTWYQIYLRYNFQNFLAGTRFRAYLRGGVSLVSATLTTVNSELPASHTPPGQLYTEHDDTFDILGNAGFGLSYSLYSTVRLKMGLQLEGEGFAGDRSQDIDEDYVPSSTPGNTTIDDTVYGVIGRLTLHADYRLGQSGRWKLTGDVGMMTKNSWVSYPDFGTKPETLYGPYVKAGASYVF